MSVFCALDDIGPSSLDKLLLRFAWYRVVHLPRVGQLRDAGFELLASFRRPHFTVRLSSSEASELSALLAALSPAKANPYHWRKRPERR